MEDAGAKKQRRVPLRDWLFAWEVIASCSKPATVCLLESLCRDVRDALAASSTGTGLMQRYWNVQYHRLVWEESHIDAARQTLNFALTNSEGRKDWKKMYREELPLWVARTFQGLGASNNALNAAKVMFKVKSANELLTGEELAKLELTPEEAMARQRAKNMLSIEGDEAEGADSEDGGTRRRQHVTDKKGRRKGGRGQREPMKDPALGLERVDYKMDQRLIKHRDKHKKGGTGRWDTYGGGMEDDAW
ncbi:hypothetical protein DQ04_09441010 [Trypanosoma grayi]|uniref:hypothetical protein n=1 Tax=Trypanosoma grayi TaxID=71804 RepID=UPI0004F48347|nr:hypothetical protein DQ04_09441010 [Trypanosoma grayi]KEG07557.1 hypothetical protein DQ04_09441010 [Trypanosoma grayi]